MRYLSWVYLYRMYDLCEYKFQSGAIGKAQLECCFLSNRNTHDDECKGKYFCCSRGILSIVYFHEIYIRFTYRYCNHILIIYFSLASVNGKHFYNLISLSYLSLSFSHKNRYTYLHIIDTFTYIKINLYSTNVLLYWHSVWYWQWPNPIIFVYIIVEYTSRINIYRFNFLQIFVCKHFHKSLADHS